MREDLERIYGAELRWLRRLSLRDRWRIGRSAAMSGGDLS